jgi:hypothetical protein
VLLLSGLVSRKRTTEALQYTFSRWVRRVDQWQFFEQRRVRGLESRCHLYDAGEDRTGTAVPHYDDNWGEAIRVAGV